MKVITLNNKEFKSECLRLKEMVERSDFDFDTLVGIASGGCYVADEFAFKSTFSIALHRPGHEIKTSPLTKLLAYLPAWFNKALRTAESKWLAYRDRNLSQTSELKEVEVPRDLKLHLQQGASKVLVVDDAVDSGRTMASVVEAIKKVAPDAEIRTAAITITRRHTIMTPDFALYSPPTIIRFPWAPDVR